MHVEAVPTDQRRTFPALATRPSEAPGLDQFLSLHDVMRITTLGKTAIYARIGRGEFPRPVPLSKTKVAWPARDIARWQQDLRDAREGLAA